jgi:rare lipoprotein A
MEKIIEKIIAGYLLFLLFGWVFFVDVSTVVATKKPVVGATICCECPKPKPKPKPSPSPIYIVKAGDTIEQIAVQFTILPWQLREANGMTAGDTLIHPGQKLVIPNVKWRAYEGRASWYGPGFHGKKMANGQIYDMNSIVCAHRTLPLGMKLKVTNMDNGKSIVVQILDRGPYTKKGGQYDREVDLSKAAFARIARLDTGIVPVKIEPIQSFNEVEVKGGNYAETQKDENS